FGSTQYKDDKGEEMKIEIFKFSPFILMETNKNVIQYQKAVKKLNGEEVEMNIEEQSTYELVKKYADTQDVSTWPQYKIFGPGGTQSILDYYEQEELFQFSQFYGAPTPTMSSKLTTL